MQSIPQLLEQLRAVSPAFREALADHLAFNGELLPYVLLEDFRRLWLVSHADSDRSQVAEVILTLEEGFADGDEDSRNLIAIALLEGLGDDGGEHTIRRLLGPQLQAAIKRMESWSPQPPT